MRLPYRDYSEAVLIGTITALPAVAGNIRDLRTTLTDPEYGGFAPDRCHVFDESGWSPNQLRHVFESADDTLLVYFVGSAFVDSAGGELQFGELDPQRPMVLTRPWTTIRDLLSSSDARYKVLILDCPFGEEAAQDWIRTTSYPSTSGACVLAPNEFRQWPSKDAHTPFTGALLELLTDGVLGPPRVVTLSDLYLLFDEPRRQVRPVFYKIGDVADTLGLVRNQPCQPVEVTSADLDADYRDLGEPERKLVARASMLEDGDPATPDIVRILFPDGDPQEVLAALDNSNLINITREGFVFRSPEARAFAAARLAEEHPHTVAELRLALRQYRMVKSGIAPKPQLTRDYWTTDDKLDYRPYAEAIAAFIRHPDSRPPLTIGVKGPWGAGKTSLMRMIRADLDNQQPVELTTRSRRKLARRRKAESTTPVTNGEILQHATQPNTEAPLTIEPPVTNWRATVWFNPWMYQNTEQVWAGLAHAIISQVTDRLRPGDRERFWLQLNLARLDRLAVRRRVHRLFLERLLPFVVTFLLTAGAAAVMWITGLAVDAARWVLAGGTGTLALGGLARYLVFRSQNATAGFPRLLSGPETNGLFDAAVPDPGYIARTGFLHVVQHDMTRVLKMVATEERPLVVFVDDLDRCSPGVVAEVIEAINLFLAGEFENCVFVLAMEPDVVAAHVEVAYADLVEKLGKDNGELGWRFLEKIVQLPMSLPAIDHERHVPDYLRALLGVRAEPQVPTPMLAPLPEAQPPRVRLPPVPELAGPVSTPVHSADLVPWATDRIWSHHPTVATLPDIVRTVTVELPGAHQSSLTPWEARRVVLTAAESVFADLYTDDAAFTAIGSVIPAFRSTNPREIKRYVNLFRFYSFITFRRRLEGTAPADTQLAKLAAIAIRWPDLLGILGRPTILARLEQAAGNDDWDQVLTEVGCRPARCVELRTFLTHGPQVGQVAHTLL